jgi:MFS family permease
MRETTAEHRAARTLHPFPTTIPSRLDRLPWTRFHWLLVFALGASWAIDGLEVTFTGAISGALEDPATLHLTAAQIGALASAYLFGAVTGALACGYLTDRHGRAKLFFVTLAIYLGGTLLTAFSWDLWSMALFRWITGFGIGGEYAAINSAIDELIPARVRGQVNLTINGSYWIGAAVGSVATLALLDPRLFPVDLGWRLGFGIGALLGLVVLIARRHVPESPRWLAIHGYRARAEAVVASIEERASGGANQKWIPAFAGMTSQAGASRAGQSEEDVDTSLTIHPRTHVPLKEIAHTLFRVYPRRATLCLVLITSQAFLYNAIFFTYALVLTRFYQVPTERTGIYLLPFAVGNFLGPLLLGRYFDSIGRRAAISVTYAVSALLLVATGALFVDGSLSATGQTVLWSVIFFFASAAASSAYLTISEIFPIELRALAIAIFYAFGTAIGGIAAPWLFGELIGSGSREAVFLGYAVGAALMIAAAIVEVWLGVNAERKSLEGVAPPLSVVEPP